MGIQHLSSQKYINEDMGFLYRYVHSEYEYFGLHNHDYYELFLIIAGEVTHIVNNTTKLLKEGSLVFVRPSDVHTYQYNGCDNFIFANLAFSQSIVHSLFEYFGDSFPSEKLLEEQNPPGIFLNSNENSKLLTKLNELNSIGWQEKNQQKLFMKTLLIEIFTKYFFDFNKPTSEAPFWLEYTCDKMKRKNNFTVGTSRMIEISGKSREHLSRSLKKHYGVTITEFINDLRLNYIANMLINSNSHITDLCYDSGFQNASWFYNNFKKKYGMSPKSFREIHGDKITK